MEGLPNLNLDLSAAQAGVVAAVMGIVALVKKNIDVSKKVKPWLILGVAFVSTLALSLIQGGQAVSEVIGLSIVTAFIAMGLHGAVKAHRKDDPRR